MINEIALLNILLFTAADRFPPSEIMPEHGNDFKSGLVIDDDFARLEFLVKGDKSAHSVAICLDSMTVLKPSLAV